MTSQQFAEWAAFAAVEPFGDAREDYRLAYGLSVIVNMLRSPDSSPVTPLDLLPKVGALADDGRITEPGQPAKPASVEAYDAAVEEFQEWAQSQVS